MKGRKRILLLTPGFAANEADSTTIPPLQALVKGIAESDWEPVVVSFQFPMKKGWYNWNSVPVYSAGGKNRSSIFRLQTWWRIQKVVKEAHKKEAFAGVHSFWLTESALLGNLLSKQLRLPHLCTLMGQDARPSNRYLKRLDLQHPKLVGLSDFHASQFQQTTGRSLTTLIPWGIDKSAWEANSSDAQAYDVLGVGSLIPLKSWKAFIDTVDILKKEFPNLQAAIIGKGPEKEELEIYIQEKKLQSHIVLVGSQERARVIECMKRSKVLLHPSSYESFGYIYPEALQSGMKICSTSVGWHEAGPWWRHANDPVEMARAVADFLKAETQDPPPNRIPDMRDTVEAYLRLYEEWLP